MSSEGHSSDLGGAGGGAVGGSSHEIIQPGDGGAGGFGGAPAEGGAAPAGGDLCPQGMFGDPAVGCSAWAICSPGEHIQVDGTPHSDRSCAVCPEGSFSTEMNAPSCQEFTNCQPGEHVERRGDDTHDRLCGLCEAGTYSEDKNEESCAPCPDQTFADEEGSSECLPWTRCGFGQGVMEQGTSVQNAMCVVASASRQFGTSAGDAAIAVKLDRDGNIYVGGQTDGALGEVRFGKADVFVRKYDASGVELWTVQLGSAESESLGALELGPDGMAYVTGQTRGAFPGQENLGETDAFLVKMKPDGSLVWVRQFGTSAADSGASLAITASGDVLIAGKTSGELDGHSNEGGSDAFVSRFDSRGIRQWSQVVGTSRDDEATGIACGSLESLYLAGNVGGTLVSGQGSSGIDMFLRKLDAYGAPIWTTQFGTSKDDALEALTVDGEGNAIVAGEVGSNFVGHTSAGDRDWFVRRYGASDAAIKRTVQRGSSGADGAVAVSILQDGSVAIAGRTTGKLPDQEAFGAQDGFVSVWSSDLKTETFLRQLGSNKDDVLFGLVPAAEGSVFVAGSTEGQLPDQERLGDYDAFLSLVEIR